MIYGSVCSGIEAATVAWEPLLWDAAWFSEIEKFPCSVLNYHYPEVPNLGDMTKLHENKIFRESKLDILVGGTPCQSFSVAGLRKGLDDLRGNLCLEFLRLVDIKRPRWFVWENVPGVLSSSRGRDFGSFLGAIQKLGYGFAWRIRDAQYFGVPQRRRRVFVVGYLGDWRPAAAVLFEREGLHGDFKKSRKEKKAVAALTAKGVGTCGADDNQAQAGHIIETFDRQSSGEYGTDPVASTISTRDYKCASDLVCITGTKTHALKAGGFDGSEDGTGRGQPIVISFNWMDNFSFRAEEEISNPLRKSQTEAVLCDARVRRLTPRECERLQGFPEDYTLIPAKKSADGPRYKALGNSMAVPVMRWIGERIQMVEEII